MQARTLTIRLVRLAMAASLLAPTVLFAFAAWNSYRNLAALTDERLARSLDVEQEEAQRTFQLVDLALNSVKDLVADMSADDIRRDEKRLHLLLQKLDAQIPLIQSIWIYDKDGRPLVSSWIEPAPDESFDGRDFIRAHLGGNDGTYYGQVYESRFGAQPFFTVSQRLIHDGAFIGVLEISVLPSNFFHFFATLAYAEGQQFSLIRNDGLFLARYPIAPQGAPTSLDEHSGFRRTIARTPAGWRLGTAPMPTTQRDKHIARDANVTGGGVPSGVWHSRPSRGLPRHLHHFAEEVPGGTTRYAVDQPET